METLVNGTQSCLDGSHIMSSKNNTTNRAESCNIEFAKQLTKYQDLMNQNVCKLVKGIKIMEHFSITNNEIMAHLQSIEFKHDSEGNKNNDL
eukprot:568542_1